MAESPDTLQRYLGTYGHVSHQIGSTGAGHPDDEDTDSDDQSDMSDCVNDALSESSREVELEEELARSQDKHIRHEAIKVPADRCPFDTEESQTVFVNALNAIRERGVVPANFGLLRSEWDADGYPEVEIIKFGRTGKELVVSLPLAIWWPRAVEWAQGLYVMSKVLIEKDL